MTTVRFPPVDAPERVDLGSELVLRPPDRMVDLVSGLSSESFPGKISFIRRRKPWSNSRLMQQALGKHEATPRSTKSRRFFLAFSCEVGSLVTVEEDDGRFEQFLHGLGDPGDWPLAR